MGENMEKTDGYVRFGRLGKFAKDAILASSSFSYSREKRAK